MRGFSWPAFLLCLGIASTSHAGSLVEAPCVAPWVTMVTGEGQSLEGRFLQETPNGIYLRNDGHNQFIARADVGSLAVKCPDAKAHFSGLMRRHSDVVQVSDFDDDDDDEEEDDRPRRKKKKRRVQRRSYDDDDDDGYDRRSRRGGGGGGSGGSNYALWNTVFYVSNLVWTTGCGVCWGCGLPGAIGCVFGFYYNYAFLSGIFVVVGALAGIGSVPFAILAVIAFFLRESARNE